MRALAGPRASFLNEWKRFFWHRLVEIGSVRSSGLLPQRQKPKIGNIIFLSSARLLLLLLLRQTCTYHNEVVIKVQRPNIYVWGEKFGSVLLGSCHLVPTSVLCNNFSDLSHIYIYIHMCFQARGFRKSQ